MVPVGFRMLAVQMFRAFWLQESAGAVQRPDAE